MLPAPKRRAPENPPPRPPAPPEAVFKALASRARVQIVQTLGRAPEKCVCDLVAGSGLGWSTVSHHLLVLRKAGIVRDTKRGKQVFYRLALPCAAHFINCLARPAARRAAPRRTRP